MRRKDGEENEKDGGKRSKMGYLENATKMLRLWWQKEKKLSKFFREFTRLVGACRADYSFLMSSLHNGVRGCCVR